MPTVDINYLAVLVAALAAMIIGALWYSPLLFMKPWMKLLGWNPEKLRASGGMTVGPMLGMLISCLVMAFVLGHVINFGGVTTWWQGAIAGVWMWLGFVATTFSSMPLFEKKPWGVYFINVGYYLVSFVVMGGILAIWA